MQLMKTVLLSLFFYFISEHVCSGCGNFSIQNVNFIAKNFEYILKWENKGLEPNVTFSIEYKRYGTKQWIVKQECQNITRLYCNLTDEIMSDEDMFKEQYLGQVRAWSTNCSLDWVVSKRMSPIDDTYIDNIELTIIEGIRSVTIFVQVPTIPMNTEVMSIEQLYSNGLFAYYMSFSSMKEQVIWQKIQTKHTFNITGLNPGTTYNGSVYIMIHNERKSDIKQFFVKTLPDPSMVGLVVILLAVSAGLFFGVLLWLTYRYVKQQGPTPSALDFGKPLFFQAIHLTKEKVNSLYAIPAVSVQFKEQWFDKLKDMPTNRGPALYSAQFENPSTSEQTDALLHKPTSYISQQEQPVKINSKTDSSDDYGIIEDRTVYTKPILVEGTAFVKQSYLHQMDRHSNFDHLEETLLNNDDETMEHICPLISELEGSVFHLLSKNMDTCGPQALLSSVKVYGTVEQKEEQIVDFLSEIRKFDERFYIKTEEQVFEDYTLEYVGKPNNTFQTPLNYTRKNGLESTCECHQPYKLQH
ncbi:interleukin-22 receptor subunit alpha-1 [Pelobates fuscus]|uniref:interleukin-22 receptor subunit alpha-1 n=1 Tax=Pelobates fuscus TaxID=191477 RepID=UPI002FE49CEB